MCFLQLFLAYQVGILLGVIAIWDCPEVFATRDDGILAGFVFTVEMKRYPLFYIYNIFYPGKISFNEKHMVTHS